MILTSALPLRSLRILRHRRKDILIMQTIDSFSDEAIRILRHGGVAVIRTDTLYGIVASALSRTAVQKVYQLKHRNPDKACIILIGDESQIIPGTDWSKTHAALARKYWPGPVSIIAPVGDDFPSYLSRAEASIAYRLPQSQELRDFLRQTGPLVAPSANPEGSAPAATVMQAKAYFGEQVDIYIDKGQVTQAEPSRLIALDEAGKELRLR